MAYAFSKINSLLSDQQQPAKADVFADAGQQAQTTQPAAAPVKSTTEGSLGPAGGGSALAAGGQANQTLPDQQNQAGRAALRVNAGRTATPSAISGISDQITQRSNDLQAEANKYAEGQKANQDYGLMSSDFESAIGGDPAEQTKVGGLLNRNTLNYVDAFKPQTDVAISDVDLLNSDRGLQQLLARGQGPTYGGGESAFDVRSLKRTPGFTNIVSSINAQEAAAQRTRNDLPATAEQSVKDYGNTALTAAQKAARDYLTGQASAIDTSDAKAAADWNAKLADVQKQGLFAARPDMQAAQDAASQALDPRIAAFLGQAELPSAVDPNKYLSYAQQASAGDFVTGDEATRFNAIMGLLGQGDSRAAGVAPTGPGYTFDRSGYQGALGSAATSLRSGQDDTDRAQIADILAAAGGRADKASQAWLGTDAETAAKAAAVDASKGLDQSLMPIYQEVSSTNPYFGIDPTKFYSPDQRHLAATDVLSSDEAVKLNALAQDALTGQTYQAGTAPLSSQAKFDAAGWLQALAQKVQARKDTEAAQVGAAGDGDGDGTAPSPQQIATDIAEKLDPTGIVKQGIEGGQQAGGEIARIVKDAAAQTSQAGQGVRDTVGDPVGSAKTAGGIAGDLGKAAVVAFKQMGGDVAQTAKSLAGDGMLSFEQAYPIFQESPRDVVNDILSKGTRSQYYSSMVQNQTNAHLAGMLKDAGLDFNSLKDYFARIGDGKVFKSNADTILNQAKLGAPKVSLPTPAKPSLPEAPRLPSLNAPPSLPTGSVPSATAKASQALNPFFNSGAAQGLGIGSEPTTQLFPGVLGQLQQGGAAAAQNIGDVLSGRKKIF